MPDAIKEAVKDIKFYLDRIEELTSRNKELEEALHDIASGKYSGMMLTSLPPKDPAVERARAALGEKKDG